MHDERKSRVFFLSWDVLEKKGEGLEWDGSVGTGRGGGGDNSRAVPFDVVYVGGTATEETLRAMCVFCVCVCVRGMCVWPGLASCRVHGMESPCRCSGHVLCVFAVPSSAQPPQMAA